MTNDIPKASDTKADSGERLRDNTENDDNSADEEAKIEPIELPKSIAEPESLQEQQPQTAKQPNLLATLNQLAPLIAAIAPLIRSNDPIGSAVSNQINNKIGEGLSQAIASSIRISFDPTAFASGFNAAKPVEAKGFYNESDYL